MAKATPAVLVWARETAGLSLEQAARGLGLGSQRTPADEQLAAFESGERAPSLPQIKKMAQLYRRPFVAFFLSKPPKNAEMGEDFRRLPGEEGSNEGDVRALIRDIYIRQTLVKETLVDSEEDQDIDFIGKGDFEEDIDDAAEHIKNALEIDTDSYRRERDAHHAFGYLRDKAEASGIYVLLIGDLGSHHSTISVKEFRGFALADKVAPFIVINQNDAKPAWSFTLLHEAVHLWVGKSGISAQTNTHKVEQFCNDVASRILLSDDETDALYERASKSEETYFNFLKSEARSLNLSTSLIAYRFFRKNFISKEEWENVNIQLREQWLAAKQENKKKQKQSSGGDFYNTKKHRAGNALVNLVSKGIHEGILTETRAGRILGVNPGNVAKMVGL
ncbi:ImmA/IrrE family metallo-endopeptidase [Halomonas sp. MMSF_3323]|uniref:ImmA/IrrE family metallo-endopeptidase n=1 Tax=Halomonas sp. MMSF_3323 TaxID=3046701 RepID=UPI00274020AF|nr:XRE family transcriptional regulator [Halomonas sp. MMSF_3323]